MSAAFRDAGGSYSERFQVQVLDRFGNPVPNTLVTFTAPVSGPSGSFSALTTVPTDMEGVATAPAFTANYAEGNFTVTAALATRLQAQVVDQFGRLRRSRRRLRKNGFDIERKCFRYRKPGFSVTNLYSSSR
jgi:Bacterial Ig-like domain (group 1)